jgi:predicted DCC family thiol-disulfide oxidoreductase YuxK
MQKTIAAATTGASIIVFDGVCVLCNRSVQFVLSHDREQRFYFATLQSEAGRSLLLEHGLDADDPTSFLLVEDGRADTASDAWIRIVSRFGGGWRLLYLLHLIPRPLRDAVYRWIARNRYRWFGKYDTCMLPSPELARRLLQ